MMIIVYYHVLTSHWYMIIGYYKFLSLASDWMISYIKARFTGWDMNASQLAENPRLRLLLYGASVAISTMIPVCDVESRIW